MKYTDIVDFEADAGLCRRLGFHTVLKVGTDVEITLRQSGSNLPQIIKSKNPGTIISAVRESNVLGIIFEDWEFSKNAVDKAAEFKKIIFIPLAEITSGGTERRMLAHKAGKIAVAAAKSKAKARVISLANSKEQLLSVAQMSEMSKLIAKANAAPKPLSGEDL